MKCVSLTDANGNLVNVKTIDTQVFDSNGKSVADNLASKSDKNHTHNIVASDITSGILPVERGGTGTTNLTDLRKSLGMNIGLNSNNVVFRFGNNMVCTIFNVTASSINPAGQSLSLKKTYNFPSETFTTIYYASANINNSTLYRTWSVNVASYDTNSVTVEFAGLTGATTSDIPISIIVFGLKTD